MLGAKFREERERDDKEVQEGKVKSDRPTPKNREIRHIA